MIPNPKRKVKLSVLIPTFNEQDFIKDCLNSIHGWADEIIISDSGSTDNTLKIAEKFKGVKIFTSPKGSFQTWRNHLLKKATSDWVFYLDADEHATPELKKEITKTIQLWNNQPHGFKSSTSQPRELHTLHPTNLDASPGVKTGTSITAYAIPRYNFLLGQKMLHGGWYPDFVKRLFLKKALKGWQGDLHEEPEFSGSIGHLKNPIIHIQPNNLEDMLQKSINWSSKEAQLLFDAHHPPATWWRILRMGATTAFQRLILKKAFLDGPRGVILALYQSWHTILVYLRLWELQLQQNLPRHSERGNDLAKNPLRKQN